jgi:hypothetical protein
VHPSGAKKNAPEDTTPEAESRYGYIEFKCGTKEELGLQIKCATGPVKEVNVVSCRVEL